MRATDRIVSAVSIEPRLGLVYIGAIQAQPTTPRILGPDTKRPAVGAAGLMADVRSGPACSPGTVSNPTPMSSSPQDPGLLMLRRVEYERVAHRLFEPPDPMDRPGRVGAQAALNQLLPGTRSASPRIYKTPRPVSEADRRIATAWIVPPYL